MRDARAGLLFKALRITNRKPLSRPLSGLRIVAFNANGGRRVKGIVRCLTRAPIANPDVVLFTDVAEFHEGWRCRNAASEIAAAMDMSCAWAPRRSRSGGNAQPAMIPGSAIVCSRPLANAAAVSVPDAGRSTWHSERARCGVVASAEFGGCRIFLGVVHLSVHCSAAQRGRQMAEFIKALPDDGPALIGGDFNTTTVDLSTRWGLCRAALKMISDRDRFRNPETHEPLFEVLARAAFEVSGVNSREPTFTFVGAIPRALRPRLDWLAVRGLRPLAGSALVAPARESRWSLRVSDHDFVSCEVLLPAR